MKGSFWNIFFYIFIGDTFATAVKSGSLGILTIAILGMLIGVTCLYPIFRPEDVNGKKL